MAGERLDASNLVTGATILLITVVVPRKKINENIYTQ